MAGRFEGKVVLVTGAGSGIGRATALAFAREGASVVAADVAPAGGEETVRLIRAAGGEATFVRVHVSKAAEVAAMVRTAVATYGRLDAAHNNAGVEGDAASTVDCTEETWDRTIGVNLKGVRGREGWLVPGFQFDGGHVVPGLDRVLRRMPPALHPLALVGWFTNTHPEPVRPGDPKQTPLAPIDWLKTGGDPTSVADLAEGAVG